MICRKIKLEGTIKSMAGAKEAQGPNNDQDSGDSRVGDKAIEWMQHMNATAWHAGR